MLASNLQTLRSLLESGRATVQMRGKSLARFAIDADLGGDKSPEAAKLDVLLKKHGGKPDIVNVPRAVAAKLDPGFVMPKEETKGGGGVAAG